MRSLLKEHVEEQIGLNIKRPMHIDTVKLVAAREDYFSVLVEKKGDLHHIPYANIVKVIENPAGVTVGGLFQQKKTYSIIVKIRHVVEYIPS